VLGLFKSTAAEPVVPGPFGRFLLQERIASGGMADIWLATDVHHRPHALRLILAQLAGDRAARKRFERGCDVLAGVQSHPSVVGYFEHGKQDGHLYCLMEFVDGANLKELYAAHHPLLTDNVAQILLDMAEGLEHVHESGYIHLDFKPENILVARDGTLRLVDFDLAQPIVDAPLKLTKNPGTPAYMAPEQLQGKSIDHRVDLFAFGVTAYELLTNQKPFPGEDINEILARQLDRSAFTAPRLLNSAIPPALEKAVLKCIETDPDRRYPFMSVLVRDLKAALYV
jgi:eukaryotic-like serine/threonine-protein kinase